ncbi:MAG: ABC transporter permease [Methanomassiliicoccus sp.]|nr:ABC transporter permease [Methanomassiliicoccus sp.]
MATQSVSRNDIKGRIATATIVPVTERKLKTRASFGDSIKHTLTMAYRSLLLIKRTPQQLFDVMIQPVIFTLLFTFLFGGAVSGSWQNYLPIIIPGILVQTLVSACMATGVQIREDMDKGVFNRFKSLPIARIAPLTGALLTDTLRYGIATALTFLMGYLLGYHWATLGGAVLGAMLIILAAWCISWIFAFLGTIARSATTVQGASTLVLFPLVFLSGAFVPTSTLPDWLQAFVNINPLTYVVSAISELFNQGIIGNDFWFSLIGSLVVVLIFAPLTLAAYLRKVE